VFFLLVVLYVVLKFALKLFLALEQAQKKTNKTVKNMSQNPAVFQKWCEDAKDGLSNHLAENVIKRCKLTQKCICECIDKIGFFGLKNVISTTHITTFNKYESFITSEEQAKNYLLWIYDLSIPSSQSEENKISSSEDMEKKMRARCNFRMAEYFGDELFPDLFRNFFDYAQYVANLICNNNNNHDNRNKNDKLFSIIKKKIYFERFEL